MRVLLHVGIEGNDDDLCDLGGGPLLRLSLRARVGATTFDLLRVRDTKVVRVVKLNEGLGGLEARVVRRLHVAK